MKKVSRLKAAGRVELDAAGQLNVATVFPSSVAWMKGKTTFSALDFIQTVLWLQLFKVAFSLSTWQQTTKIRSAVQSRSL